MAKRNKTPIYVDRGHGIGEHSWNATVLDRERFAFRDVKQAVVRDVHGERATRYNLDTRVIETMNCDPIAEQDAPWTFAQVEEVVRADRPFGVLGQAYGTFSDPTPYGLWDGRRPSIYSKEEWARVKGTGKLSLRR